MIPILDVLTPIVSKILDFIPDPQKKAEAQLKLQQELDRNSEAILAAVAQVDKAQADTNTAEAQSTDPFVSRARPAIMWICAAGMAWSTVLLPVISSIMVFTGHGDKIAQLPPINGEVLMTTLGYMLGYGGMRSWEKSKGVAS